MTVRITRMRLFLGALYTVLLLLALMAVVRVTEMSSPSANAMPASEAEILMVDPDLLLKLFVEDRGASLQGDAFLASVEKFDRLVGQVAAETYAEYGVLVVKADLVLAGGLDYTTTFYARISELWDAAL